MAESSRAGSPSSDAGRFAAAVPLSPTQRREWILHQVAESPAACNLSRGFRLAAELDREAFEAAVADLRARHRILRARFGFAAGALFQAADLEVARQVAWSRPASAGRGGDGAGGAALLRRETLRPLDLEREGALRVSVGGAGAEGDELVVTLHRIAADELSADLVVRELKALYAARLGGADAGLEPPVPQYDEVAERLRREVDGGAFDADLAWWEARLEEVPPGLHLPTDRPRPPLATYRGAAVTLAVDPGLPEELAGLAGERGASLYAAMLAAYQVLLFKLSGQSQIVVGSHGPTSPGPGRREPELAGVVGPLDHPLALTANLSGRLPFVELLERTEEEIREAMRHGRVPFAVLLDHLPLERHASHAPVFQATFELVPPAAASPPGTRLPLVEQRREVLGGRVDLALSTEIGADGSAWRWEFNPDLFEPGTVELFARQYRELLASICAGPDRSPASLPLLADERRRQLVEVWNRSAVAYVEDGDLPRLFEEQVAREPDAAALRVPRTGGTTESVTYRELDRWANRLAHLLVQRGVAGGERVGICLDRSPVKIAAVLAVLKAGAVYVPLDPNYPEERLRAMVRLSRSRLLIGGRAYRELLESIAGGAEAVCLEDDPEALSDFPTEPPLSAEERRSPLAYALYTSGSTGEPKAVLGTTRGVLNRLAWTWEEQPFEPGEVCCLKTSMSFVDHVAELFAPLLGGVPVVIVDHATQQSPRALVDLLAGEEVTRIVLLPSQLGSLLGVDRRHLAGLSRLRHWYVSGEILPVSLAKEFFERLPHAVLFNLYGCTEVAADATALRLERSDLFDILDYFRVGDDEAGPGTGGGRAGGITTAGVELQEIGQVFGETRVPEAAVPLESYMSRLSEDVLPHVVDVNSPYFIGHMTSSMPSFMPDFSRLISRLNQNVVKIETSKSLTFLERETLAMLHRSFFELPDDFYEAHKQSPAANLGLFVSGGTMANLTALWCARNRALPPGPGFAGVVEEGLTAALEHHGYEAAVVIGSPLVHYSVDKAASILGLGRQSIRYARQRPDGTVDVGALADEVERCREERLCVIAVVAIGGATETGTIDPLDEMADVAREAGVTLHVDAAWGAPLIFSDEHRHLLAGIERADSITMCGHKQFYLPMGVSLCLFRDPGALHLVATGARYQAREEGYDLGRFSAEGSRPASSLLLHAALNVLGREGYARLMDEGIRKARYLERRVRESEELELVGRPVINIVNYRYLPRPLREKARAGRLTEADNRAIDEANVRLQETQFLAGRTFVSRTRVRYPDPTSPLEVEVMRSVLANPLTRRRHIDAVLDDQRQIAARWIEGESRVAVPERRRYQPSLFEKQPLPVGRPLPNVRVYILDDALEPVPVGVPGEIYVGGEGVAAGYLDVGRTAERFVPDPFSDVPGARMFRTGDLGRVLSSGSIEYLDRVDHQVKIEGHRVELGEIETTLARFPSIEAAAVVLVDGRPRAFAAAPPGSADPGELRAFLRDRLPDYMMPEEIVRLDALPLNHHGKVDRRALAQLGGSTVRVDGAGAPRSAAERELAALWCEALDLETVDRHADFFDLGGHSLDALRVVHTAREDRGLPIRLRDLFAHPTIAELADELEQRRELVPRAVGGA